MANTFELKDPPQPLTRLPALGSQVFIFERIESMLWKFTPGIVVDLFTKPAAVKVKYVNTGQRVKHQWFGLDKLAASMPVTEQPATEEVK